MSFSSILDSHLGLYHLKGHPIHFFKLKFNFSFNFNSQQLFYFISAATKIINLQFILSKKYPHYYFSL
jgi:hypothetical protein